MLMFKRDIRTTQLAREIDVPQQTLQRIVAGLSPNPHRKTLEPLADFFSISVDQLTGKTPLPDVLSRISSTSVNTTSTQQVPLIECGDVACFLKNRELSLVKEYLVTDRQTSKDAFAMIMNDSSMEPYLPQGAILILDPNSPPRDRGFVLVSIQDSQALVFRQLLIDGEHRYLKPMNSDLAAFPMRLLCEKDHILGILVEMRHRYDH